LSTPDPDEESQQELQQAEQTQGSMPWRFPDGTPFPPEMLQDAPPGMIAAFRASMSFTSGPVPQAEELAKYNGTIDGGANRVMELIEQQAAHRRGLERLDVEADISLRKLGLIFAFALALIATVGGLALIAVGDNAGALGPILTAVALLAGCGLNPSLQRCLENICWCLEGEGLSGSGVQLGGDLIEL
jgi:uncharacterized membrane protein